VCELVTEKPCVLSLTEYDIIHCLRTEVQRLHGDYGIAVVHLSLRGLLIVMMTCLEYVLKSAPCGLRSVVE